jgi:GH15 family glucan-1,4-alpha-glucosidase
MLANADQSESPTSKTHWRVLSKKKSRTEYKAISDYGLIGDQRTCALVGIDGSIDWLCIPRFDSPSVFGAILDVNKGGKFSILPDNIESDDFHSRQYYEPGTNILATEFKDSNGIVQILDFMPCFKVERLLVSTGEIHRRVSCLKGKFGLEIFVEPRMNYGQLASNASYVENVGYEFRSIDPNIHQEVALITNMRLGIENNAVQGHFVLSESDRPIDFVFRYGGVKIHHSSEIHTVEKLKETREYWKRWASETRISGKWKEMVVRSSLVLKLLVYAPTGAIVAAPTTSLPEEVGGVRNWDYRYSWVRDSAFVLWAFHSVGHDEAENPYLDWLMSIYYLMAQNLQVMLGISAEKDLTEMTVDFLEGYKKSSPVRVGNAAWDQLQLDVYGILLDAVYFSHKHRGKISRRIYEYVVRPVVRGVIDNWEKPDCGIWEVRGKKENFVYSKMWCWVALDRAVKIAKSLDIVQDISDWTSLRDKIKESVLRDGWDAETNSFVRSFGSNQLDAANLLMPQVRFIDARDPKMSATIDATISKLLRNGKFLYRYRTNDGLPGDEGAFLICSFWLVNCLTLAGRLREAEELLDSLAKCSNHLGLFSEEVDPDTGEALGNYPQAFTHMGFISAAKCLSDALEREKLGTSG